MKLRSIALVVVTTLAGALVFGVSAGAQPGSKSTKPQSPGTVFTGIPVTGPCTNQGNTGTFVGTINVTQFIYQNEALAAVGNLSGACSVARDQGPNNEPVSMPVDTSGTHTCQILDLVLGPLHLDLLGLVIDLSKVTLHITAQQGSGKLLGNLLCAIAHLLDGSAGVANPLPVVAPLLNSLIALLG